MIIPQKLKLGDTIGLVSTSSPISKDKKEKFLQGVAKIEKMGFKIKYAENFWADLHGWDISAGTPGQKVNDLHKMFIDSEVKAVFCSIGGKTSNATLDLINYKLIKQHPKIFSGFSDNTTLVNAIYNKTGLVTFYGPDIWSHFCGIGDAYTRAEFMARFTKGYAREVRKNSSWEEVRVGKAKGRLVGGSLGTLLFLAGTPYFSKIKNSILFLESYGKDLRMVMSQFYHLEKLGIWKKVKGVLMGYNLGNEKDGKPKISIEDLLLEVTKDYDFPILKVRDFGHRTECTPIPIGVKAKIDTRKLSFKILERYVK